MVKQWGKFIDKWVGPNLFGGQLAQTLKVKTLAVFWCSLHYTLLAAGHMLVVAAVFEALNND